MEFEELKIRLEEGGVPPDLIDELVSKLMVSEVPDENKIPIKDVIAQLQIEYNNATDWKEKSRIAAQIISLKLDKGEY